MHAYTLGFVYQPGQVLMLRRVNPPNRGLWNGLGGSIEPGERPQEGIVREIREEAGLELEEVRFGGVVTWGPPGRPGAWGGMYVFTLPWNEQPHRDDCPEGELAWKSLDWVYSSSQVVGNIPYFLPPMLAGRPPVTHQFIYASEADGAPVYSYRTQALSPQVLGDLGRQAG